MRTKLSSLLLGLSAFGLAIAGSAVAGEPAVEDSAPQWVTYVGTQGPGVGKKIVLVGGDEEYRSEESLPMLARILSERHGFTCVVLFAVNPATGEIDPNYNANIPGLENLRDADLMILLTRWRNLPADQMAEVDAYLKSGRPVLGLRTATHAFKPTAEGYVHYADGYSGDDTVWEGGFGRLVIGEKWVSHHGGHKSESTRGVVAPGQEDNPILRGLPPGSVWGDSDVYGVRLPLPGDSQPLLLGQVLTGMKPTDPPVEGKKNDPMMPVAWIKSYEIPSGKKGEVFATTMGAATDLATEGTRRLVVNAVYFLLGMGDEIPAGGTNVDIVGDYEPSIYGFNGFKKGMKPGDFAAEKN